MNATEQARKDMERLSLIKKKREADAAKRALTGRKAGMSSNGLDEGSPCFQHKTCRKRITETLTFPFIYMYVL